MPSAATYIPSYTVEDYLGWDGDWELWDGIPVSMSPSPSYYHQSVGSRLLALLSSQLANEPCHNQCEAVYGVDWHVSATTVVRPDLMVICEKPEGQWVKTPPEVIVEILSPSTRDKDLVAKRELYSSSGVLFYLIIDPENQSVVVLKLDDKGTYREAAAGETFFIHESCSLQVDEAALFSS